MASAWIAAPGWSIGSIRSFAPACPADPPTEQDVREALTFLFDEWLVDVALDRVGKAMAIMLAMTLIERALLPERPAFFVTAGQRGGGKTTLVNMITLAALGRRAAAAGLVRQRARSERRRCSPICAKAWRASPGTTSPEARRSACPHIEAALTAAEISDRVLGVSRVETVPSTTVQIFTGNSITPRGDMASRSLMLALNVDRPDPENRTFAHADPLAWTQANRPKIVRALYTLLIAGALNRPQQQEAKTRFKTWWSLVGWPMEYAAGLIGVTVDCTELMRAGEVGDEEATAASAALSILHEIWGGRTFTARDVVKAMTIEPKIGVVNANERRRRRQGAGRSHRRRFGRTGRQALGSADGAQHRQAVPEAPRRPARMDRRRPTGRHAAQVHRPQREHLPRRGQRLSGGGGIGGCGERGECFRR